MTKISIKKNNEILTTPTNAQTEVITQQTSQINNEQPIKDSPKRILSIDRFRGFTIFCMIVFPFIAKFENLGFLTRLSSHSLDKGIIILPGMTIADLIAPMFMFAIALTYRRSYKNRLERDGKKATILHFVLRYLALIGLGAILWAVDEIIDILAKGKAINTVLIIFIALSAIAILIGAFAFLCNIKALKKFKSVANKVFLFALAIIGICSLLIAVRDFAVLNGDITSKTYRVWGILSSLGIAGLFSLPFIMSNTYKRLLWGILFFTAFLIYHEAGNQAIVDEVVQGGFIGGMGWASIIILGSVVVDFYNQNKIAFWLCALTLVLLSVICVFVLPLNKTSVSPGYVIVSLTFSLFIFLIFECFNFLKLKRFDFFEIWGKNPILMFLIKFTFIGLLTTALPASVIKNAPIWAAILWVVAITALLTLIAWLLNRKKIIIKL